MGRTLFLKTLPAVYDLVHQCISQRNHLLRRIVSGLRTQTNGDNY
jgi:hypothetical protein